jgi:hypothetical protein
MRFGTFVLFPRKKFIQASEVDQELECEIYQTKYKVMIGCDMDWPPWQLLILFALVMRNGKSRETLLQVPMLLSLNIRRIRYYTLITGQCGQNVGIRWGWTTSLPLKETCNGRCFADLDNSIWPKSTYKGMNHKMEDNQGCRLRGWNKDRRSP